MSVVVLELKHREGLIQVLLPESHLSMHARILNDGLGNVVPLIDRYLGRSVQHVKIFKMS